MAISLYFLIGFMICFIFYLAPTKRFNKLLYFALFFGWFPLFLAGLVILSIGKREQIVV